MAWGTIRRATSEDIERLENAAQNFAKRHKIDTDGFKYASEAIDAHIESGKYGSLTMVDESKRLGKLWKAIVKRALQCDADGIAYGHVGYHAD